jgi:hypothetical protein
MIAWRDGLERGPDGPVRQVPTRHVWTSTVWVTRYGTARRRFFNPVSGTWSWAPEILNLVEDSMGNSGYAIDWFTSVERAIALAWRRRGVGSTATIRNRKPAEPPNAKWLSWNTKDAALDDGGPLRGEVWMPMKRTRAWRCGAALVPPTYKISSLGRLMSPNGAVTRGFLFNGRRWAAAKGAGLVDLESAARLSQDATKPAPRILAAIDALGAGASPTDLALVLEIELSTAWSYYALAAAHLDAATLRRRVPQLVGVGLWRHLEAMRARGDPLLGGRLLDLAPICHAALPACAERVAMLRLARLAVTKRIGVVPGSCV